MNLKKKLISILILFFISSILINGQTVTFQRTFDTLGCYYSNCVQQNIDKGYILCGSSYNTNLIQQAAVVRTDSLGNIIWVKDFGGISIDGALECLVTIDSNILVVGIKDEVSSTDGKIWIFFLDQNGNLIQSNEIKILSGRNQPESLEKCRDGGFIISGLCNTSSFPDLVSFLLKIDSNGNVVWSNTYGQGTNNVHCGIETLDNGFLLAGEILVGAVDDIYLVKTDSVGDTIWTKTFGTPYIDCAYSIRETTDSNIVIASNVYNTHDWDFYISKVDNQGTLLWSKRLGDSLENTVKCLQITSDGNFLMAGTTKIPGNSNYQALLIKVDANGDTLWVNDYGDSDPEYGYYIIECDDQGFILTGKKTIFNPPHDAMYLIKVNQYGLLNSFKELNNNNSLVLFPNPAHNNISFRIPENFEKITYFITDVSGRTIISGISLSSLTSIEVSNLADGIYLITINSGNLRISNKFIKY